VRLFSKQNRLLRGLLRVIRKIPNTGLQDIELNLVVVKTIYDISTNTGLCIPYYRNVIFNEAQSSFHVVLRGTLPTLLKNFE